MEGIGSSLLGNLASNIIGAYQSFVSHLPPRLQVSVNMLFLTLVVVIYAVFIWKFYTFISTKNILKLDLNKYNRTSHPLLAKFVAGLFYLIEYAIILPLLIFFWFTLFTVLLLVITKGIEVQAIVLISAITIASIRATSYIPKYGERVSSELAKIIPLTLLGLSLTNPLFFSLGETLNQLLQARPLFNEIGSYLIFIVSLELVLRLITFIGSLFKTKEIEPEEIPKNN
jgi:hypothetical protein